jgi:acetyl-CoA C-acetyltransferase
MHEVVILDAVRTAIGNINGGLAAMNAAQLGETVIRTLLKNSEHINVQEELSEVIMGQVLTGGTGQNPARQASIAAGVSQSVPAWTVNQVCGSGLKAVMVGAQSIALGHANMVIAGGQESMSQAPHCIHLRNGTKMGNATIVDSMILDGLTDAFSNLHMGLTAENVAAQFGIARQEQDEFALLSQQKASAAQKAGKFKEEIVPVTIKSKKGDVIFTEDEFIRHDASAAGLAQLRPAFQKDGTITAGNASGINDGAAAVLLMRADAAKQHKCAPIAIIRSYAQVGIAPDIMGISPIAASRKALDRAGWKVSDLDLIEANEAFAVQSIYVAREMGWDLNKVNVNGGAIALGHPIGASGARVLVTLLHEMRKRGAKKGLVTLCIGGGMGVAMCVELI